MRVLHIVGDSRFGGIARIILGLGRVAQAEGWEFDVLTTDPTVQQALQQEGLGIVNLDVIRRTINPFRDIPGLFRLAAFLRRERYDIVHTHTSKGGFVGRLAASLAHSPLIVHTVHGFAFHEQTSAIARIIWSSLERLAARRCHSIVSVSEFHKRWALELGICSPARIQAIPNGITPASRSAYFDPATLRRHLGAENDDLLVLSLARLAPDKGLGFLIDAATLLSRDERRYRIVIAGDGPMQSRLEQMIRDRGVSEMVKLLGFRQDVGDLLAASDVVVIPSLREGLSISLLEAMAAGKPIIASSIGSHRELAAQAEMARLVPPADPTSLAAAIQQLAADRALRAHLAARARSLFEARYTEDKMLNAYQQMYRRLLNDKSPHTSLKRPLAGSIIRSATTRDLHDIVTIHRKAFDQFFLTRLGPGFLRMYYELVLGYRAGIVLVSEKHGILNGFVCGFVDPAEFYRLMWRHRRALAAPAMRAVLRRPWLAVNVMHAVRRLQTSAEQWPPKSCELSSIAVAPEEAGNGLGKTLLRAFLDHSWSKRAQSVYLTTDAEANERANALYREMGFRQSRRFLQRKGRWMNEYVVHHAAAEQHLELHP
jgi:glycosyltransferase involved in cell wall biosynthesis/ribosomal protein S18 acetylase RimI-like enzyme